MSNKQENNNKAKKAFVIVFSSIRGFSSLLHGVVHVLESVSLALAEHELVLELVVKRFHLFDAIYEHFLKLFRRQLVEVINNCSRALLQSKRKAEFRLSK
jgi:hypothetical protein